MLFANSEDEIRACFPALLILRPHLPEAEFVARIRCQQEQGYHLVYEPELGQVHCVAGFRILEFLAWGRVLYIDDLITVPEARGRGLAGALLDQIIAHARDQGCDAVHLDSGFQRHEAHRLYLNRRFRLECHHFALSLNGNDLP